MGYGRISISPPIPSFHRLTLLCQHYAVIKPQPGAAGHSPPALQLLKDSGDTGEMREANDDLTQTREGVTPFLFLEAHGGHRCQGSYLTPVAVTAGFFNYRLSPAGARPQDSLQPILPLPVTATREKRREV